MCSCNVRLLEMFQYELQEIIVQFPKRPFDGHSLKPGLFFNGRMILCGGNKCLESENSTTHKWFLANPREPACQVGSLQQEQHVPGCFPHASTYVEEKKKRKGGRKVGRPPDGMLQKYRQVLAH